jgi:hypothetical protein
MKRDMFQQQSLLVWLRGFTDQKYLGLYINHVKVLILSCNDFLLRIVIQFFCWGTNLI